MDCGGEPVFTCQICKKELNTESALVKHMKSHPAQKKYKCQHCTQRFSLKKDLLRHEATHPTGRPFKCNFCDMRFTTSTTRSRHEKSHEDDEPVSKKSSGGKVSDDLQLICEIQEDAGPVEESTFYAEASEEEEGEDEAEKSQDNKMDSEEGGDVTLFVGDGNHEPTSEELRAMKMTTGETATASHATTVAIEDPVDGSIKIVAIDSSGKISNQDGLNEADLVSSQPVSLGHIVVSQATGQVSLAPSLNQMALIGQSVSEANTSVAQPVSQVASVSIAQPVSVSGDVIPSHMVTDSTDENAIVEIALVEPSGQIRAIQEHAVQISTAGGEMLTASSIYDAAKEAGIDISEPEGGTQMMTETTMYTASQ